MIKETLQMLQRSNSRLRLLFKDETIEAVRITAFEDGALSFITLNSNKVIDIPLVHSGNISSITIYEDEALLLIDSYLN